MKKTAVVFSGQGAQFVGMGKDLAGQIPVCRDVFTQADTVLGYCLSALCFEGPLEDLTKSNHCQPAIFAMSMACYRAIQAAIPEFQPAMVAGLSLGEWSALHAAGVLTLEDTLRMLKARGEAMQAACAEQEGGMVSVIGLSDAALKEICAETGVEIANLNAEDQTVLSGPKAAIVQAEALAKAKGAKRAVVLGVAGAFHSSLMASAVPKLEAVMATVSFQTPRIPVIANVTGKAHGGPDEIRRTMLAQVTRSVHWHASVNAMVAAGVTRFVECGPGKVLTGLIKRIAKESEVLNVQDLATLEATLAALRA